LELPTNANFLFKVHDELGRGNFLAIYLASGVVGSMMSLTNFVLLGQLGMSSLGASAGTSGIVAAWCMFHSKFVLCTPSSPFLRN
jgi:membrane associated rhomboid family serine protease